MFFIQKFLLKFCEIFKKFQYGELKNMFSRRIPKKFTYFQSLLLFSVCYCHCLLLHLSDYIILIVIIIIYYHYHFRIEYQIKKLWNEYKMKKSKLIFSSD